MVSVAVRDAATKSLYERNVGQRLNRVQHEAVPLRRGHGRPRTRPAFHHRPARGAPVRGGKVRSDLFLRGGGDPTMLAEDYRDLAQQLRAAGVTPGAGRPRRRRLVLRRRTARTAWSWDDGPYYGAVTSGLTVAPDTDYDSARPS